MWTLLKALPDFFLCILRSLPYLNKTCFHQGGSLAVEGTSQGTIQAVLGSSIQQKILPSLSIYLFIFTYLFIHFFYFLFLYLLFSISFSFIFLYLLVSLSLFIYFMWDTCAMHTREGKWRKRAKNEDVAPCNNEKLTRGYIGLN